jgi:hypothetical protein
MKKSLKINMFLSFTTLSVVTLSPYNSNTPRTSTVVLMDSKFCIRFTVTVLLNRMSSDD